MSVTALRSIITGRHYVHPDRATNDRPSAQTNASLTAEQSRCMSLPAKTVCPPLFYWAFCLKAANGFRSSIKSGFAAALTGLLRLLIRCDSATAGHIHRGAAHQILRSESI
ncbi:hypothetical protein GALL_511650 [mine drainage metagenome]|uniref:Uncharacterized protein n=1 Tax=mine drainage metagenome TaxID=410659 RepID=A0A1J5PPN5_9ZZZZ